MGNHILNLYSLVRIVYNYVHKISPVPSEDDAKAAAAILMCLHEPSCDDIETAGCPGSLGIIPSP
jgi:hypothetical protein